MSAHRGTAGDDSKGFRALRGRIPSVLALRGAFAVAGLIGALALLAATFATIIEIEVGTTNRLASKQTVFTGWDRHGPALLLLGIFALVMLYGALRGSRPAMAAVAAAGICALLIALVWDLPDVHDTGAIGDLYSDAHASPKAGYYLETLGGALLLLSGGGLLLLRGRTPERELSGPRQESAVA
jgi:hypothetical protein